jgi:hypothetical protein
MSTRGLDLGTTAQTWREACTRPLSQICSAGDQVSLGSGPTADRAKPQPILNPADVPLVEVEEFGWCCAVGDLVANQAAEYLRAGRGAQ